MHKTEAPEKGGNGPEAKKWGALAAEPALNGSGATRHILAHTGDGVAGGKDKESDK